MTPPVRECPECGRDVEDTRRVYVGDYPGPMMFDGDEPPGSWVTSDHTECTKLLPCGHTYADGDLELVRVARRDLEKIRSGGRHRAVVSFAEDAVDHVEDSVSPVGVEDRGDWP